MKMMIPTQLNKQRFCLTQDKQPFEKDWQTFVNYEYDDPILHEHLRRQPTYGVVGGINNLVIVDFDSQEVQDNILPHLPPTFSVKTATKGLLHLYYYTDDTSGKRYRDRNTKKGLIDIQGNATMVVGPGSKLSNGKSYEVFSDTPIATIYKKELLNIIANNIKIVYETKDEEDKKLLKKHKTDLEIFQSPEVIQIKETYKISNLLSELNIPIHKNPTECPFHESESKACFHYDDQKQLFHCFHPGCIGGDVITLYSKVHNLDFKSTIRVLKEKLFRSGKTYEDQLIVIHNDIKGRKKPAIPQINSDDIEDITKILIEHFHFVTIEDTEGIYYYDTLLGVYKPNGQHIIGSEMEKYFGGLSKTSNVNEITNKVMRQTYTARDVFNAHPNLICLSNGVFNLETKILIPHNPEYYFLNYFPISYNISAKCPRFLKFVSEIVEPEDYDTVLEMFGWTLMKNYDIQKVILLVGTGANGKSVLMDVLKSMLGDDNISAEDLHPLCTSLFSPAQLFGKTANIAGDISSVPIAYTGVIKKLTGNDTISGQFKFQNTFTFRNTAKLIFGCNNVPITEDLSAGYMRRWQIIKFPFTFEGANDNKDLRYELACDDELSGIFNVALEKYYILKETKQFSHSKTIAEIRDEYISLSDPLQRFIDEYIVTDSSARIMKADLYAAYNKFAKQHNIPELTAKMLTINLNKKNIRARGVRVMVDGNYTVKEAFPGINWAGSESVEESVRFE